MRMGVLKNIIDQVCDENHQLRFETTNLYEGKRFEILNYRSLLVALQSLVRQSWVKADKTILTQLKRTHGDKANKIEISPEEHSKLSALVKDINQKLPIFYGILGELVQKQEEHVVNIKIPESNVGDLDGLSSFNKELQEVFKLIVKHKGLRGDIEFKGFDVGTSWYEILITGGPLVYSAFLGVIDIADRLIQVRKNWYESEDIRLSVEAKKRELKKKDEAPQAVTDKDIDDHITIIFEIRAEKLVTELLEKFPEVINNQTEMQTSILKGLHKMIALMEQGAEFHPSLNPPDFVKGNNGQNFSVDYERLKKILEKKEEATQIEHKKETGNTDQSGENPKNE